jgi:NhaP-type Na+/H+ or K+/H+ antiporter
MSDMGINFSWGYVGAIVLGAFIGFVAGEVVERVLRGVWAKRRREMSSKMPKHDLIQQRISQTAINSK